MKHSIKHNPSYSMLDVELDAGETVMAEAGAMVYMSEGMNVDTRLGGGLISAILRKVFGGESMFFNVYTATQNKAEVGLAPELAGDIIRIDVGELPIIIQRGSYLCSEPSLTLKTRLGGWKSIFSREGLVLLETLGKGWVYLSSYGGIIEIDIDGEYILDTGHMVAFEKSLDFSVTKTGGWKSTLFSGEGLTMRFTGRGKLWIQTRVARGFISWLVRLLPA